ncbi:MAG: HDOD domain-containing protein [Burkholderiaceae bacterium]
MSPYIPPDHAFLKQDSLPAESKPDELYTETPRLPYQMTHTIAFLDNENDSVVAIGDAMRTACPDCMFVFASTYAEALDAFSHQVDVLIAPTMTASGSTLELFAEVQNIYPKTLRIALIDRREPDLAARFSRVCNRTTATDASPAQLAGVVRASLQLRDLLTNKSLRQLVSTLPNVPTLPEAYQKIQTELQNDTASISSISKIIESDPALTARMLQLANSPMFGISGPVSCASDAIKFLGINTIAGLVLGHGVLSQFNQRTIRAVGLRDIFWRSTAHGQLAREVIRQQTTDQRVIEQAMTAGLLCDIGTLVLAAGKPEIMAIRSRMLAAAKAKRADQGDQCDQSIEPHTATAFETQLETEIETELFGFNHMQVGAMLLSSWGLPDAMVQAVAFHHCPDQCADRGFGALAAVYISNILLANGATPLAETIDLAYIAQLRKTDLLESWQAIPEALQLTAQKTQPA